MTIADYIFAACMTVVIVWIVAEGEMLPRAVQLFGWPANRMSNRNF
jgi:hypothetical protein